MEWTERRVFYFTRTYMLIVVSALVYGIIEYCV